MATPNSIFKIHYEAKNFETGLTDVVAYVKKPNGVVSGLMPMTENSAPFNGTYGVDYQVLLSDPHGEYIGIAVSPTNGIKSSFRFSVSESGTVSGGGSCDESVEIDVSVNVVDLLLANADQIVLQVLPSQIALQATETKEVSLLSKMETVNFESKLQTVKLEIDCEH